jgi:hypothetical protein
MINASISLPIIIRRDEELRDLNEVNTDFFLTGSFSIPVKDYTLNLVGKIFYNWANQGILMNTDREAWENAFD